MAKIVTRPVSYRGGLVEFVVPSHWKEEHDPAGSSTFWDERPHSGTLRLSVISARGASCEALVAHFDKRGEFDVLANGLHLRRTERKASENGVAAHVHRWEVAVPVPPDRLRIVTFTWTVEARHAADPANATDLRVMDTVIRQRAVFSQAGGSS